MRFTVAATFLAAGAMAGEVSTDYATRLVTVTDCGPDVPDCPVQTPTVPMTTSTVYATNVVTITDCAPEVPDCPAHSTIVTTETVAISTTVCPVVPTEEPEVPELPPTHPTGPPANGTVPVPIPTGVPTTELPGAPEPTVCVPTHSTTAITKSYTTVLTSVEYSTIEIPCETETPAPTTLPPVSPPPAGNTTVPEPPVPTGAAGTLAGSAFFAAAAGVAAFVLA